MRALVGYSTDVSVTAPFCWGIRAATGGKWSHVWMIFRQGSDECPDVDVVLESVWKVDKITGKNGLRQTNLRNLLNWRAKDTQHRMISITEPLPLTDLEVEIMYEYLTDKIPLIHYGKLEIAQNFASLYVGRPRPFEWRCTEVILCSLLMARPSLAEYFDVPLYSQDMFVPSGRKMMSIETGIERWMKGSIL